MQCDLNNDMVEYSDILAHLKCLFPKKRNSELTKMSYYIWRYCDIKDTYEISQKIKHNTSPQKKNLFDSEIKPSVYIAPQNPLRQLTKEEIIKQKADSLLVKDQKRNKENESKEKQISKRFKNNKKQNNHRCNHSFDDIIAESRGRCINGTFVCKRCGKTRHIGYKYKSYINICLQCKQKVCKKSCGSIWAIYTPMK